MCCSNCTFSDRKSARHVRRAYDPRFLIGASYGAGTTACAARLRPALPDRRVLRRGHYGMCGAPTTRASWTCSVLCPQGRLTDLHNAGAAVDLLGALSPRPLDGSAQRWCGSGLARCSVPKAAWPPAGPAGSSPLGHLTHSVGKVAASRPGRIEPPGPPDPLRRKSSRQPARPDRAPWFTTSACGRRQADRLRGDR